MKKRHPHLRMGSLLIDSVGAKSAAQVKCANLVPLEEDTAELGPHLLVGHADRLEAAEHDRLRASLSQKGAEARCQLWRAQRVVRVQQQAQLVQVVRREQAARVAAARGGQRQAVVEAVKDAPHCADADKQPVSDLLLGQPVHEAEAGAASAGGLRSGQAAGDAREQGDALQEILAVWRGHGARRPRRACHL